MTDPPPPQPEPVMDAAKIAAAVAGAVTAAGAALVVVGWATAEQVRAWAVIAGGVVSAVGALLAVVMPLVTARGARAQVTPLASPRDHTGPLASAPETGHHGRHEAAEEPPPAPDATAAGHTTTED